MLWSAVSVAIAFGVGLLVTLLIRRLLRRHNLDVEGGRLWRSPIVALFVTVTLRGALAAAGDYVWTGWAVKILDTAVVVAIAWILVDLSIAIERAGLAKYPDATLADPQARHARTQITLLRRITESVIITLAVAAILWSIPAVRQVGAGIFASAGIVGIIAGLAAQTSLGNVFAGIQIAFTDAIRIGDVVDIDGHWGKIEEITLTYVVLRIWDGTCLILPCTYFNTTNFHNWTHRGTETTGLIQLSVDWRVPIDELRAELHRFLATCPSWDGKSGEIKIDDATGDSLTLIAIVSAADADTIGGLRWDVREALVTYLQAHYPTALPTHRLTSD